MFTVIIYFEDGELTTNLDDTSADIYAVVTRAHRTGRKISWFKIMETTTGRIIDETVYPAVTS